MATPANPTAAAGPQPSAIQTQQPFVKWKTDIVAPPNAPYFQENDFLNIALISNTAGLIVLFSYRVLTPQGEIKEGRFPCLPTVVPFSGNTFIPLLEGWLLSFSLRDTTTESVGQFIYATVQYSRTLTLNDERYGPLWQGYVFNAQGLGLPASPTQTIDGGAGQVRSVTGTTPAAGADINEVVPVFRRWNLLAFISNLTTSATVANRNVTVLIDDGTHTFFLTPSVLNQAASLTSPYELGSPGSATFPIAGPVVLLFQFPMQLKAGYRIRTSTFNLQAGDQWTAPQYVIAEWGVWDL